MLGLPRCQSKTAIVDQEISESARAFSFELYSLSEDYRLRTFRVRSLNHGRYCCVFRTSY